MARLLPAYFVEPGTVTVSTLGLVLPSAFVTFVTDPATPSFTLDTSGLINVSVGYALWASRAAYLAGAEPLRRFTMVTPLPAQANTFIKNAVKPTFDAEVAALASNPNI